jgi:adenylate cyclase 10
VSEYFKSEEIDSEHGGKFYRITGMGQGGIRTRADAVLLRNMLNPDDAGLIQNKLRSCIPAAIMPYLEIGYEKFGSETRRLTVMFASLGVDLSSAQT